MENYSAWDRNGIEWTNVGGGDIWKDKDGDYYIFVPYCEDGEDYDIELVVDTIDDITEAFKIYPIDLEKIRKDKKI